MKEKLFSGRFWMTMMITATTCYMLAIGTEVPPWWSAAFVGNMMVYYFGKKREGE